MKTYILDEKKSMITWKGKNDKMQSKGDLQFSNGKFFTELGELVEGFIGIDFDTLRVSDSTALNDDQKQKLVEQWKSESMLDTSHFPKAEYKIVDIVNEAGETKFKGIFSLKNEAFGLNFPVNLQVDDKKITAEGDFKLQHVNHQITEKVNNKIKGENLDDIEFNFKLVAQAEAL